MRILSNGNVGIGMPNPGKTLDVTGDIRASGTTFFGTGGSYQVTSAGVSTLANTTITSGNYLKTNMILNNPKCSGGGITTSWQTVCTLNPNGYAFVSGMLFVGGNENSSNRNIQTYLVSYSSIDGWRMSSQINTFTVGNNFGNYSWQLLTTGELQAESTTPYGGQYWVDISKLVYH